jgi:hypothetical protein
MKTIHGTIEAGDEEAVREILLERPEQVNAVWNEAYPDQPLHLAVWQNHLSIAGMLLDRDANINASGDSGFTPLHFAASYGRCDVARLLISRGADPNIRDDFHATPLFTALRGREPECLSVAEVDLNCLVMQGKVAEIQALLNTKPDALNATAFPDDLIYDAVIFIASRIMIEAEQPHKQKMRLPTSLRSTNHPSLYY